jgi:GNAT superfamily N-acetyltransferase
LVLDLTPRPGRRCLPVRPLTPADAEALREPFQAAFALAPEYAAYPQARFIQSAAKYFAGFFGTVRGEWSPTSVVGEAGGRIVGAALVKRRPPGPLLDCLFVRPEFGRRGWATALVNRVVRGLLAQGETRLQSYVLLANEASLNWHKRFGFREVPDLMVASHRARVYGDELERHRQRNDLPETELAQLQALAAQAWDEVRRFH